MPFQPGNQLAKRRTVRRGGRPPEEVLDAWEKARQRLRRRMAADADGSYAIYKKWQKVDPATSRHAVSTILGDEEINQSQSISINFVQYNNTVQLRPEDIPAAVLAGNGQGHQASVSGVASPQRQGQDGIKFHNFEDVS